MNNGRHKALFLDRDGVINLERRYVHCRETFQFQDGIFELCRAAQNLGYLLVVVTNQAGIARGHYTEQDFLQLTEWMIDRFAEQQIQIARVYYCPYHPVGRIGESSAIPPIESFLRDESDVRLGLPVLWTRPCSRALGTDSKRSSTGCKSSAKFRE